MDLVVLNLFAEWWDRLRFLLHRVAGRGARAAGAAEGHDRGRAQGRGVLEGEGPGGLNTFMRYFCAWLVLFGSKFVILEAIAADLRQGSALPRASGTAWSR
jgi:hypothetical protein